MHSDFTTDSFVVQGVSAALHPACAPWGQPAHTFHHADLLLHATACHSLCTPAFDPHSHATAATAYMVAGGVLQLNSPCALLAAVMHDIHLDHSNLPTAAPATTAATAPTNCRPRHHQLPPRLPTAPATRC